MARTRRAAGSTGEKAPRARKAPAHAATGEPFEVREAIEGLRAEVAALRESSAAALREALAEVPKAEDFQPLADHLYEFAQSAPRLLEGLESVSAAVAPIEGASRAMQEIADTLQATHESWRESLLQLPRAEDYEPLSAPLREFARVSPALTEALAATMRAVGPVAQLMGGLTETTGRLERLREAFEARSPLSPPSRARGAAPPALLAEAAAESAAVAQALREALDTLPRDPEYARVAGQLRELASVSPSLAEWLNEVPPLALPLGDSVAGLRGAALRLDALAERLRAAASGDASGPPSAAGGASPASAARRSARGGGA
ncbi:MAG: hypothetical protein AB7O37_23595 [Vicinamibacteria bacterium]